MSLSEEAMKLAESIGADVIALKQSMGDVSQLNTNSKTVVGALQELQAEYDALQNGGTIIES